jgi:hypothetical protein
MINVSSEFRDKLNNGNCNYLSYADITLKDGTTLNLTNDDIWNGGVTIEDAVSSGTFEVGSAVINQCTIVINNIYDKFTKYDFKEAVVSVQLGIDLNETEFDIDADDETESSYTPRIEKIKKGVYTVDDTKYNGSIITLTCIDNMGKFDRAYSESKLEYPATLKTIVMDACDICGVTLNTPDFSHSDYIINTRPTDAAVTFREVIAWCGQISGNYCRCNVNGQLELKWFNQSLLEKALINLIPDSLFDGGITSWKAVDAKIGTDTIEYKEMLSIIPNAGKTGYAVEAVPNLKLATNYTIGGQFFMQYPEDNDVAIVKILNGTKELASKEIELNDGWTGFKFDFTSTSQNVSINIGFKGDNTLYVYKPYLEEKIPDGIYQFNGIYNSDVATDDVVITGVRVMEKKDTENSSDDSDTSEGSENTTSSDDGYINYQTGSDGYLISIENNELIKDGAGQTVSGFLGEQLIGFAFRKATITHISDPTLEAGDVAILTDSKFDRYKILVSSTKFNTNNSQTTSSNAESTEKNSAVRYSAATKNYVEYRKQITQEKTDRQKALEELKNRLNNSSGTYTTIEKDSAGGQIFYLHNKPQLKDSNMIWKMTAEAWGVSTDGGKTYNAGMTVDGDTIVRYLKATGLTADVITSGRIQVKDSFGNTIFLVDMDTGKVVISGDNISIGGKILTEEIEDIKKAGNLILKMDNEYQGVSVDHEGNYVKFPKVTFAVQTFWGQTDVTKDTIFSFAKSDGVNGTFDTSSKVYTVSSLTTDTGWIDVTATYMTYIAKKRFNIAKIRDGSPGRVYLLEPSINILKKAQDGSTTPDEMTFKAYYRDGTNSAKVEYQGIFVVEESKDGKTWTKTYESSIVESSLTYSFYNCLEVKTGDYLTTNAGSMIVVSKRSMKDVLYIRCRLYTADKKTVLDEESIPLVMDVEALTHEQIFNLLTNNGAIKGIYKEGNQLYISFTYAKGGELALGGKNNGNGVFKMYDENNNVIGTWDKDGINATKGTFSGELKAASGTFTGKLEGVTGTFSGELKAATGTFTGICSNVVAPYTASLNNGWVEILRNDQRTAHMSGRVIYKNAYGMGLFGRSIIALGSPVLGVTDYSEGDGGTVSVGQTGSINVVTGLNDDFTKAYISTLTFEKGLMVTALKS